MNSNLVIGIRYLKKMSFSESRSKFHKIVKILHKLGTFVGFLPFTFDGLNKVGKRSRVLECYSILLNMSLITFLSIVNIEDFVKLVRGFSHDPNGRDILIIVSGLEYFSQMCVLITLLMCLISNGQSLVDLVNEGIKIEKFCTIPKFYNHQLLIRIILKVVLKDVIFLIGYFSFLISSKKDSIFFYHELIMTPIFCIAFGYGVNLKIICFYYVSFLLRSLNKKLESLNKVDAKSINSICKTYQKLLIFLENTYKIIKINTTALILNSLVMMSGEVRCYI